MKSLLYRFGTICTLIIGIPIISIVTCIIYYLIPRQNALAIYDYNLKKISAREIISPEELVEVCGRRDQLQKLRDTFLPDLKKGVSIFPGDKAPNIPLV